MCCQPFAIAASAAPLFAAVAILFAPPCIAYEHEHEHEHEYRTSQNQTNARAYLVMENEKRRGARLFFDDVTGCRYENVATAAEAYAEVTAQRI